MAKPYCNLCGHNACECVPCKTCGAKTPMTGTRLCEPCWMVEHRLADYLKSAGGRAHVAKMLAEAEGT